MKNKIIQVSFCVIIILIITIIGVCTLFNNKNWSEHEWRNLSKFPKMTIKNLFEEKIYTQYTKAFEDQLEFREELIKFYYLINPQTYISNVAKGKEGQLFTYPLIINDEKSYIKNLTNLITKNMNNVAKNVVNAGSKFIFVSVPRKDVVMDKYLPDSYIRGKERYLKHIEVIKENISEDVQLIDAYEIFNTKKDEYYNVYYQTDHHLNIRGGYYIFQEIVSNINKDGNNIKIGDLEEEYEISSRKINGSFNRKIGQIIEKKDEELILTPKDRSITYIRKENGVVVNTPIFQDINTYGTYMSGEYPETVIYTNGNNNAPNILFVGSSYTNILEALAVYKFNKVVSIDYRYNKTGKGIEDYVKEHDIDYTIFICSQQNDAFSEMKQHLGIK